MARLQYPHSASSREQYAMKTDLATNMCNDGVFIEGKGGGLKVKLYERTIRPPIIE